MICVGSIHGHEGVAVLGHLHLACEVTGLGALKRQRAHSRGCGDQTAQGAKLVEPIYVRRPAVGAVGRLVADAYQLRFVEFDGCDETWDGRQHEPDTRLEFE
jgi:hypothetical protein